VAISGAGITANTVANSAFQTGSVENYMSSQGLALGMRNRIINGAMQIDQRNNGAANTPSATATNIYNLDRWYYFQSQASKMTVQQNSGAITAPAGFSYYLGANTASAVTVGTNDYFGVAQTIEGFNCADLAWGTASAKTITLSFWVRSSLTGTFGGAIQNAAQGRSYPFTYSIVAANTWEYKTITISGDTSGTWVGATNGGSIRINFGLGMGSAFSGTAGSWSASNVMNATGATSVVGTAGATWYITGVQFEAGSTATPFEFRQYGTEFNLCQRYFQAYIADVTYARFASGFCGATTAARFVYSFPVKMRTIPTASATGSFAVYSGADAVTAITGIQIGDMSASSTNIAADVSSGLTVGHGALLIANNSASARFNFNAEL
jgi:hypothetical protein